MNSNSGSKADGKQELHHKELKIQKSLSSSYIVVLQPLPEFQNLWIEWEYRICKMDS
jgi:hypothetical protein